MESAKKLAHVQLKEVQESFGDITFGQSKANNAVVNYLRDLAFNSACGQGIESYFRSYDLFDMLNYCFQPAMAKGNIKQMSIYESRDKMDRGIRLIGKPARLVKRMIPYLTEIECNAFAVWWNETFVASAEGLELIVSKEQSAFKEAYIGTPSRNTAPNYSRDVKPLDCSCMRHKFDNLPIHPAETYASGDFTIVYVKTNDGKIAARCVVQTNKTPFRAGPIYTQSQFAANMIHEWMESSGADFDSFHGAKMLKEEYDSCYVLPYLDCGRGLSEYDSEYLIIDGGDIEATSTSGLVSVRDLSYCDDCDDSFDSDDAEYINDRCICPLCRNSNYFYCYESHEYVPNEEAVEVYYYRYNGRVRSDTYSQAWVENNAVYCESDCEYWKSDCVVYLESESEYYPSQSEDIFQSDCDGEYYLVSDMVELPNGDKFTEDQAKDSGLTCVNGKWISEAYEVITKEEIQTVEENVSTSPYSYNLIKVDKLVTVTEIRLRINYELTVSGDTVRNPDFFDLLGVD